MKTEVVENNPSIDTKLESIITPLREKYGHDEYINYDDFEKLVERAHDLPTYLLMHRLKKNESAKKLWEFRRENFIYKYEEHMTKEIRVMTLLKFINDFNGDNIISSIIFHSMKISDIFDIRCLIKLIQGRDAYYELMVGAVNKMPNVAEDTLFLPQHQRLNEVINYILAAIGAESIPVFDELIELHRDKIIHLNKQIQWYEEYEVKRAKDINEKLTDLNMELAGLNEGKFTWLKSKEVKREVKRVQENIDKLKNELAELPEYTVKKISSFKYKINDAEKTISKIKNYKEGIDKGFHDE